MSANPDAVRYVLNRKIIELEIKLIKTKEALNDLIKFVITGEQSVLKKDLVRYINDIIEDYINQNDPKIEPSPDPLPSIKKV